MKNYKSETKKGKPRELTRGGGGRKQWLPLVKILLFAQSVHRAVEVRNFQDAEAVKSWFKGGYGCGSGCGCSRVFAIFMCFWSTFAKFLFCASDCNFKCVFDRGVRCVSALVSSGGFCSFLFHFCITV